MISPWTRGNRVFTERADHNSQILFVEEWLKARGYQNIQTDEMVHWRREHMSNLVNALDFDHPDFSIPNLPDAEEPAINTDGAYVGASNCEAANPNPRPPVPYGKQDKEEALWFEEGYKECVGYLTEGRSLVFERHGFALENPGHDIPQMIIGRAREDHSNTKHRWVIHYTEDEESQIFKMSSALDGRWIGRGGRLHPASDKHEAADIKITFRGNGWGYELQYAESDDSLVDGQKTMKLEEEGIKLGFWVWSVTYR